MDIRTIGIHTSVDDVFPATKLRERLQASELLDAVRVIEKDLSDLDALVTLEHLPAIQASDVQWIHSIQSGVDRFPVKDFQQAGIVLTNSVGIHESAVSETAIGYILMFARGLHTFSLAAVESEWRRPEWDQTFTVGEEDLCVIGTGTLGAGIARRAGGLGMNVRGVRRSGPKPAGVDELYSPDELHDAVEGCRFVALAVPLTTETRGMIGETELRAMDESAYLLNVARGPIINEQALVHAIRTETIAGAALDVFDEEPLPADSPLWNLDNVIITPHAAGLYAGYYRDVSSIVRTNLERLAAGEPLENRVI